MTLLLTSGLHRC